MPAYLGTIAANIVLGFGASAGTALAVASFVGTYGLLLGGLALSASAQKSAKRKARDQFNAAQTDRLVNVSSTVAPRELVLGRVRKGGTIIFRGSIGTNKATFVSVIAIAGHEIDAVETVYLNDIAVTLDGSGNVTTAPYALTSTGSDTFVCSAGANVLPHTPVPGSSPNGYKTVGAGIDAQTYPVSGTLVGSTLTVAEACTYQYQYSDTSYKANIRSYLGTDGQAADSEMMSWFPGVWTSAHRARGVAYLICRFEYSETAFPTGLPNVTATIRGAKCYDPRTTTTVWTENPALHMRHVYQHAAFGKAAVTAAEDARITTAANACDTSTVYTVGGVAQSARALYKSSIVASFGAAPKDLFDDLSQAMAGSWAFAGGELYLKAGTHTASVMSLSEADLAVVVRDGASESMIPIGIAVHRERAAKFNTVEIQIWDAAQSYKQVKLVPLIGAALVTRDGATLTQAVTYPAIGYAPQAQHVAGVMMRDARDPLTVVLPWKLKAYPLELFDTVAVTISRYGWSGKLFTILARDWSNDGALKLTLKETAASIFTVDADFSAQGGAANTSLPSPWYIAPPGTLTITSGTNELVRQADGTIVSRMRVTWPAMDEYSITAGGSVEVQYRDVMSAGEWASEQVDGAQNQLVISAVTDGAAYTVRARARNRIAVSDWGTQAIHTVVGKTEAPPPFDTFLVLAQPDGTRQYKFGYASEADKPVDWLGAEIRYVAGATGSPDWDTMTPLVDAATYWTSSPAELNAPLAGEWTFACKSIDTSGNKSTYLTQTITLAARRLGAVFDEYYEHTEGWLGVLTGCQVQEDILQSIDATTWATAPATWAGLTSWNFAPTTPIYYETPERDFGAQIVGLVSATVDAVGTVTTELATSPDGVTWSGWSSAASQFNARWLKLRITVTATGPAPVPVVRTFGYTITAPIRSEYINDVVISALAGSYRIGTGDIRIPLVGTYTVLKKTDVVIQDSTAGTWVATRIDQTLTYGPRWQFRLNGTLTDPSFVDFYVEGY